MKSWRKYELINYSFFLADLILIIHYRLSAIKTVKGEDVQRAL